MITPRLKKQFRLFRVAEATWWKRVPRVMFLQLCELYFFLFFTPFPSYSCSFPLCFSLFSLYVFFSDTLYCFSLCLLIHLLTGQEINPKFDGLAILGMVINPWMGICIPMTRIPIISFYGMVDHGTCTMFWPWHMCVCTYIYSALVYYVAISHVYWL